MSLRQEVAAGPAEPVVLGRINGLFGVRGWVKVYSHTEPREQILSYSPWQVLLKGQWRELKVLDGHLQGKAVVARIEGYDDRDLAATLIGAEITVERSRLPRSGGGEYYWVDLIGCEVVTTGGVRLGRVETLFETGSNDVLVVSGERERLLPFQIGEVIKDIDLVGRRIEVDWDPEF